MASHSFAIRTAADLLTKLEADFQIFLADPLSSSKALNCVFSAWHMSDWWYEESSHTPTEQGKKEYQRKLRSEHDFLRFMSDIANGSKHIRLSDPNVQVKDTSVHQGDFNNDFSLDFDVPYLKITLEDRSERIFAKELENALNHWRAVLRSV
ncbi:MAG: hypothetical protein WEC15_03585 [Flavobacteriales bacterium]